MEENLIQKESNILDPVHDTLDQEVFNGTTPKSAFFEYHLDHVREVFRQNNFNPHAFDFYLTGSLCTYQYSDKSDVDISIVCNADEFDEEDRAELIGIVIESLDGTFFPRTTHQYQHFVQPIGVDIEDLFVLGLRSAWDFQKNEWVLKPKRPTREIKKEKPDWVLTGVQISDKINTLIDNHRYEEAKTMYKQIHQRRKEDQIEYGDFSEGNVIYKFLDNNGTFDRLRNIGQRIAFQKQALATDDYVDYYYDSTFYNSDAYPKTHLNSKGYPCSCSFGKKNPKAVHQYYKDVSNKKEIKVSLNKTSNEKEESKIRDMAQKILDKQIDSESKWAKKYPLWKERVQTKIIDENRLQENSIKFFAGLLNLYKKEIQKSDPSSNSSNYANILNTREERVTEQKETFRMLWTGNFGKNTKIGQSDFFYDLNLSYLHESQSAYDLISQIERMLYRNSNLNENVRFVWSKYYGITNVSTDPEILSIINKINSIVESKIQEMAETEHLDYGFLTTIDLVTRMSKDRFAELRENAKDILNMIIDGSLFKMRPEELLDFYVQDKFNYPFRDTITDSLANVIYEMNAYRLQYLLNEYKDLRFPTNLEGMSTFGDVLREVRMIVEAAKEREEYKQLLIKFKNGEVTYDSNTPVFTFEVKKGNPEKAKPGTWGVYRLDTTDDLELEGDICNHCIGQWEQPHIRRRSQDLNTVYSVRDPDGVPWVTIELDEEGVTLGQAFGRKDHAVRQNEQKILNAFFGQESFQRESSNPDRYMVRTADGDEWEYSASSVEEAVNQHNQTVDQYVGTAEEKKLSKPVAAYGAGHSWFDKPDGQRTGLYYDGDLPTPEEDIETTEEYISSEDYWEISSVPEVRDENYLNGLWHWVDENHYHGDEAFINLLSYTYPDSDTDIEELERNNYGEAIVRIVEPLGVPTGEYSRVYNFIDNIVNIYSNAIFDEDGDITDEIWDFYETIKGLGAYIIITILSSSTPERQAKTILNSYSHYLQKKTSEYSKQDGKKQISILNAIKTILNSFSESDFYNFTIEDMYNYLEDDDAISKSLEIEYGSWSYGNNLFYNESYVETKDIEAEPLPKNPSDRGNDRLLNYIQQGINLCDEIKNILNNYFQIRNNSPVQRTMWFNEEENTITEAPTKLEPQQIQPGDSESDRERRMKEQDVMRQEVVQSGIYRTKVQELLAIVNFVSKATQISISPIRYLGAALRAYNTQRSYYDLDHISNLLEYIKNTIYSEIETPNTTSGQMNFYEMPPEPSTEEFERWQKIQEGLLATGEPYVGPNSWPSGVGYLNG